MSYVFNNQQYGNYEKIPDTITNAPGGPGDPNRMAQFQSQPYSGNVNMTGSGVTGIGDPGQYGFTPQPTGGGQQLAGLMSMQQAQFAPLLAGPQVSVDDGTGGAGAGDGTGGAGAGDGTGGGTTDQTQGWWTDYGYSNIQDAIMSGGFTYNASTGVWSPTGGSGETSEGTGDGTGGGGESAGGGGSTGGETSTGVPSDEDIQALIDQYNLNNPYIQDYTGYTPDTDIQALIDQYNLDNPMTQDYTGFTPNTDIQGLIDQYNLNNPVAQDLTGFTNNNDIQGLIDQYNLNNPVAQDYTGYYDQAYVDNLLSGINGLNTPNPGAGMKFNIDR